MNTYYYKLRTKVAVSQKDMADYIHDTGYSTVLGSAGVTGAVGALLGLGAGAGQNLGIRLLRPDNVAIDHDAELKRMKLYSLVGGLGTGGYFGIKQYLQNKAIKNMVGDPKKTKVMYNKLKSMEKALRAQGMKIDPDNRRFIV